MLRRVSEKVIISYDSDEAGKQASLRGLDILTNLGVDVRILQMDDAKDPDEFIIRHGNAKFGKLVENAISLFEFKVKMLKGNLNLDSINDKIKFLNEVSKLLNVVEKETDRAVYIEAIAKEYKVSKEAIYAEVNKIKYANNKGGKILERRGDLRSPALRSTDEQSSPLQNIPKAVLQKEELLIALLINEPSEAYTKVKDKVLPSDLKIQEHQKIVQRLYEELEKGNSNVNDTINYFSEDENIISILTKIISNDYEIKDAGKAIADTLNVYEKEKLTRRRDEIIRISSDKNVDSEREIELLKELQEITTKLAKL